MTYVATRLDVEKRLANLLEVLSVRYLMSSGCLTMFFRYFIPIVVSSNRSRADAKQLLALHKSALIASPAAQVFIFSEQTERLDACWTRQTPNLRIKQSSALAQMAPTEYRASVTEHIHRVCGGKKKGLSAL